MGTSKECISNILCSLLSQVNPKSLEGKNGEWYNIAPLGKLLKEKGIEYKGKLKDYLSDIDGIEFYVDQNQTIPITYIQLTSESIDGQSFLENKKGNQRSFARNALFNWAFFKDYSDTIKQLKEKALQETWNFEYEKEGNYSILDSYLRYTFYRVQNEKKIVETKDGKWALFNTGLVNNTYLPIYALFEKNRIPNKQSWYFNSFIAKGEKSKAGKISIVNFPKTPQRAQYFHDANELLYIVSENSNELFPNYEHIITDNVERLPLALLRDLVSKDIEEKKQRKDFSSIEEYDEYSKKYVIDLQEKISQGNVARKLQERFRSAIDVTRNRVLWNYKTAIPTYYPKSDSITLLLPLCLVDEEKVDLALVVSKGEGGYLAETIYPLDWAYKCARLICRPDSDWLTPSTITISNTEEDND